MIHFPCLPSHLTSSKNLQSYTSKSRAFYSMKTMTTNRKKRKKKRWRKYTDGSMQT